MLTTKSTWCRENIDSNALRSSSLPRVISQSVRQKKLRKAIIKPIGWYGQGEVVKQILAELERVFSRPSDRWKWLESEKPEVKGLPIISSTPIDLLDNEQGAKDVLAHAQAYVRHRLSTK